MSEAPATETAPLTVTGTFTLTVDPDWVEFCTVHPDLFIHDYCGYWLRSVAKDPVLGRLVKEEVEDDAEEGDFHEAALLAWHAGAELPEGYYRMDAEFAKRSWVEGVKKFDVRWYEEGDADTYDWVVQQTLLGKQVYA